MTATARIRVHVNGDERLLTPDTSVAALFAGADMTATAVARNREVVPRAQWPHTRLADGDVIEVVRPVQGGAS